MPQGPSTPVRHQRPPAWRTAPRRRGGPALAGRVCRPCLSMPASQHAFAAAPVLTGAPAASTIPQKSGETSKSTPRVTPKPTPKPAPKPTPTPAPRPASLTVRITSVTSPAYRNSYASLTAKTAAAARCSIDVEYASGSSTAAGLGDRTASSTGAVAWTWKVGGNTTKGTWPIYVSCSRSGQDATASTSFRVA